MIFILFILNFKVMADSTVIMPNGSDMGLGSGNGIGSLLIGALLGGGLFGNRGGAWGNGYGAAPAASAVASEVVLTPTLNAIQSQISNLSNEIDSNAILAGITSINQNVSGTSRDIGRDIANLSTAQAQGNFTTLTSINGLGRDVTAAQNQAALQQLNSFNQLTTTTLQGFNNQQFQTAQATNQIIAQGTTLASAMQECCCEIKQVVKDDGNATRALINDLNVQNLTAQLNDAKNQISNSSQTNALVAAMAQQTNVLLQHLHPVVS